MKTLAIGLTFLSMAFVSSADYAYTINTYQILPDLFGTDSMLITGQGGGGLVMLQDNSSITVEGTSILSQGTGGVWHISLAENSHLDMFGGEVHQIDFNNNATAILKGGLIESIYSYQIVPDPHITLYYSGNLPTVQEISGYDFLIGQWGDGTDFSIYLHDTGYNVYGNFNFILVPEPAGLALLALGGLLIRRKR